MMATESESQISFEFNIPFQMPADQMYTPYFVGRADIIATLHGAVASNFNQSGKRPVPVILHGTGGAGKTQIALEYMYRHQRDHSCIIWIDSSTLDTILRSFRHFADRLLRHYKLQNLTHTPFYEQLNELSAPSHNKSRRSPSELHVMLDWLSLERNERWLLIYDNYDDIELFDIRKYMPAGDRGTIIITSRRRGCSHLGIGIDVNQMSEQDSLQLLKKSTRSGTEDLEFHDDGT